MTDALASLLDWLIPQDESPGAVELGVDEIVRRDVPRLEALLESLAGFADLDDTAKNAELRRLEDSGDPTFAALAQVAHAAYYADPRSWPSLGYTTNIPGRP